MRSPAAPAAVVAVSLLVTAAAAVVWLLFPGHQLPATPDRQKGTYHLLLGKRWSDHGMHQKAADEYAMAVKTSPTSPKAHSRLGWSELALGRPGEALEAFDAAISLSPLDPRPIAGMGEAYFAMGQYAEAAEQFAKATELDPTIPHAHRGLAWSMLRQDRPLEAVPAFDHLVRLRPSDHGGYMRLAESFAELDMPVQSEAMYVLALRVRRDLPPAHSSLGWLKLEKANSSTPDEGARALLAQAEEHFLEALRYDPDFAHAREGLEAARAELSQLQ